MKNPPAAPLRILMCDDNPHGLQARKMILEDQGYHVEAAPNGETAWDIFQHHPFDLLITDYRMEELDGLTLIRMIRDTGTTARIILLSGYVQAMGLTEATTGADEVIAKSAQEVPHLLRAVRKLATLPAKRGPARAKLVRTRKVVNAG